jgi:hypothetical protein
MNKLHFEKEKKKHIGLLLFFIVSAIGHPTEKISKSLDPHLRPHVGKTIPLY